MRSPIQIALAAIALTALAAPAMAEEPYLDPSASCVKALSGESDQLYFATAYAYGYNTAVHGTVAPVYRSRIPKLLELLKNKCLEDPGQSFQQVLIGVIGRPRSTPPAANADDTGASDEAAPNGDALVDEGMALLRKFLDPDTDKAALTWSLKPTPADIRAAYSEPLASALIEGYDKLFKPGVAISGKPGQTQLRMVFASFAKLKSGDPVLKQFPGGYERVLRYMIVTPQSDPLVARFKFVAPGEDLGMAFDGLIHVNGKWVFMPKPWRVIPQE